MVVSSAHAQEKLSAYEFITEERIRRDIHPGISDTFKVVNLFIMKDSLGNGKELEYSLYKNKSFPFFKAIFTYEFYKTELQYAFRFPISITQDKKIEFDSAKIAYLPYCALTNTKCNLISKDSALALARKDSFFSKNFSADLIKEHKGSNFYWYIIDKSNPKVIDPKTTDGSKPCRIIDAFTGIIVSRKRSWTPKQ